MKVIITGASSGIGFQLSKIFSKNNHDVLAIARSEDKLKILRNECENGRITILPLNLNSDKLEEELPRMVSSNFSPLDILVNNAGILVNKPFESLSNDDFDHVFETNVKGPFRLIRLLKPYLGNGSHIVNIGSMGGFQGSAKFPGLSLYSASKGALSVLTECLAEEFKNDGISVNCLALGAAQTEMLEAAFPGYKAPVSAAGMADCIYGFAISGHQFFNGKILPVSVSTP